MTKIKPLKLSKICGNFSFRETAVLAQYIKEEKFKNGQTVFKEGEDGSKLFIVADGKVAVKSTLLSRNGDYLTSMDKGDFFGELSLFGAGPRKVSAVAIADNTILFSISRDQFENLCSTEPFVSYKLIKAIIDNLSGKLKKPIQSYYLFAW